MKQVLQAIVKHLLPLSEILLKKSAEGYLNEWNFPNCCGAIDGKHVRIVCPKKSGSAFYNYKGFHSIILLAIVDPYCKFIAVDVGSHGREGDAGILPKSSMGKKINSGQFNLPPPAFLPQTKVLQPHVLGDSAFSLTENMMKPYPIPAARSDKTIAVFNYRHCRARRTSENAFGILCQYFRVFFTAMALKPATADYAVVASCILHNILRQFNIPFTSATTDDDPVPNHNLDALLPTMDINFSFNAEKVREIFGKYFVSKKGSVGWQNVHVNTNGRN